MDDVGLLNMGLNQVKKEIYDIYPLNVGLT